MSNLLFLCFLNCFVEKHKMHNYFRCLVIKCPTFGGKQSDAETDVAHKVGKSSALCVYPAIFIAFYEHDDGLLTF